MNKDANSSVESENAFLHDMAELAVEGNPPNIYKQQCGIPKKGIMLGIMAVNKLGEVLAEKCITSSMLAVW